MGNTIQTRTNEIRSNSMTVLEYPKILDQLFKYIHFSLDEISTESLEPSYSIKDASLKQHETTEAVTFIKSELYFDIETSHNIKPYIDRAARGAILTGSDLLEISDTLSLARIVGTTLASATHLPILSGISKQIPDLGHIESAILSTIGKDGSILDTASSKLEKLRNSAKQSRINIVDSLHDIVNKLRTKKVLQEDLLTEKHGRMVLMVKSTMREYVEGIVHDSSDSGATLFIEPLELISLGNKWRELNLAAKEEEKRILQELSSTISSAVDMLLLMLQLLIKIDVIIAKGHYSIDIKGVPVNFTEFPLPKIHFTDATHPLLTKPVPNSFNLVSTTSTMLITGPNAGGKTVALKTIGLLSLMAQAGLHVPAQYASMSMFDGIYANIGDQQDLAKSMSTFSSHISNIQKILSQASSQSMVLIDELGSNTDPEEGTALAKALLLEFADKQITLIATSHHQSVANLVQDDHRMINASVDLDTETLEPTYRLSVGTPSRSYALDVASRLGMPISIVNKAVSLLNVTNRTSNNLLLEIQEQKQLISEKQKDIEAHLDSIKVVRKDLTDKLADFDKNKDRLIADANMKLMNRISEIKRKLRSVERTLPDSTKKSNINTYKKSIDTISSIQKELESPSWKPTHSLSELENIIQPGQMVYIRGLSQPAKVLSTPTDGKVNVSIGSMKSEVGLHNIEGAAHPDIETHIATIKRSNKKRTSTEIDVRGTRVQIAIDTIDKILNDAYLSGLHNIRIIHGVGTGTLRKALRNYLINHPLVQTISPDNKLQSDGATIVNFL